MGVATGAAGARAVAAVGAEMGTAGEGELQHTSPSYGLDRVSKAKGCVSQVGMANGLFSDILGGIAVVLPCDPEGRTVASLACEISSMDLHTAAVFASFANA